MIKEFAKFQGENLEVSVNYEPDVIPCKRIKFVIDGKEGFMDHSDFYAMLMLFGTAEEQENLLTTKRIPFAKVRRIINIKATKDIKEGEVIVFPYTYYVPTEMIEDLKRADKTLEHIVENKPEERESLGD